MDGLRGNTRDTRMNNYRSSVSVHPPPRIKQCTKTWFCGRLIVNEIFHSACLRRVIVFRAKMLNMM